MTNKEFKKALKKVYEQDIEHIIKPRYKDYTVTRRYRAQESKRAKQDKELLDRLAKADIDIEDVSFIALLHELKSAEVLKNVLCYVLKGDNET